jgi:hypothetical protein
MESMSLTIGGKQNGFSLLIRWRSAEDGSTPYFHLNLFAYGFFWAHNTWPFWNEIRSRLCWASNGTGLIHFSFDPKIRPKACCEEFKRVMSEWVGFR